MEQVNSEVGNLVSAAIDSEFKANIAWLDAAEANERANGRWQVTLYCLQQVGISDEDIRLQVGGSPSTVQRWKRDLVQPARKIRKALFQKLFTFAVPLNQRATLVELHTARAKPYLQQKTG